MLLFNLLFLLFRFILAGIFGLPKSGLSRWTNVILAWLLSFIASIYLVFIAARLVLRSIRAVCRRKPAPKAMPKVIEGVLKQRDGEWLLGVWLGEGKHRVYNEIKMDTIRTKPATPVEAPPTAQGTAPTGPASPTTPSPVSATSTVSTAASSAFLPTPTNAPAPLPAQLLEYDYCLPARPLRRTAKYTDLTLLREEDGPDAAASPASKAHKCKKWILPA